MKVLSTDMVQIAGENRLRYHLLSQRIMADTDARGGSHQYDTDKYVTIYTVGSPYNEEWIEGIGYTKIGTHVAIGNDYTLACVTDNGVEIYRREVSEAPVTVIAAAPAKPATTASDDAGNDAYFTPTYSYSKVWTFVGDMAGVTLQLQCESDPEHTDLVVWNGILLKEDADGVKRYVELSPKFRQGLTNLHGSIADNYVWYFNRSWEPRTYGSYFAYEPHMTTPAEGYRAQMVLTGVRLNTTQIDTVQVAGKPARRYLLKMWDQEGYVREKYTEKAATEGNFPIENYWEQRWDEYLLEVSDEYVAAWIEGVGYTRIKHNGMPYTLACVTDNGEEIYRNPAGVAAPAAQQQRIAVTRRGETLAVTITAAGEGAEIALYDTAGRLLHAAPLTAGATTATIAMSNLPHGTYIVALSSTTGSQRTKTVW